MNKEKFTLGEWEAETRTLSFNDVFRFGFQVLTGKKRICFCETDDAKNIDEMSANAALIAAAPEMYKALQQVCSDCESLSAWEDLFNIGRPDGTQMPPCPCKDCYVEKALKKARGEK